MRGARVVPSRRERVHKLARLSALLFLAACLGDLEGAGITEPQLIGEGRRALFIGNSYTYYADIDPKYRPKNLREYFRASGDPRWR